jgi:hypothetical protein
MKKTITLALSVLSVLAGHAQQAPGHLPCRTHDPAILAELTAGAPELLDAIAYAEAELEAWTQAFAAGYDPSERSTYVVPVVFHIIHNGGPENISDAQVLDAMRILNEDFNKLNPDWQNVKSDFLPIVADVGVEFRLAKKDPNGNCTNGITRTQSTLTNQGDQAMKNLIQWPRNRYLNVWVCANAMGAAGYTQVPGSAQFLPASDGIVMQHTYVGSNGTGAAQRSRALTHEVGHWINLQHTWGPSNNPGLSNNCTSDDGVTDTPNTIGWTTCNVNGNTCNSLDNVENYMEYSYCSKMFTNGQKTRMIAALTSNVAQRNNLHTAANLNFTGVDGPGALCVADFTASTNTVCGGGGSVTFTDLSYHNVTSRSWSFPGGNPSSSTAESPVVSYSTPGTYDVVLTVNSGGQSLSVTRTGLITVLPDPGASVPAQEGFEAYNSFAGTPWSVANPDNNNTWTVTSVAASSGSKSARVVNTAQMAGQRDDLFSSTFDMSGATQINISFKYAYARRTNSNDDRLRLYVSSNCGQTWSLRRQLRGSTDLNTGGVVSGDFVPNAGQWNEALVNNISNTFHSSDFRIRFEFESDGGNNVYIDDININGMPVSVGELTRSTEGLLVMPNPAAGAAQAVFQLTRGERARVELLDVLGRRVAVVHEGLMQAGEHRLDLPIAGLEGGLYFVRLTANGREQVTRLVVK